MCPLGEGLGRCPPGSVRVRSPRSPLRLSASGLPSRWAFVPASQARTPSFFFQAAGRRCGQPPPLAACRPAPSAVPTFPLPGPRGAGPPQATAGPVPVPGGGLEPFQTRNAFGLLDFEMAIYHHI